MRITSEQNEAQKEREEKLMGYSANYGPIHAKGRGYQRPPSNGWAAVGAKELRRLQRSEKEAGNTKDIKLSGHRKVRSKKATENVTQEGDIK